MRETNTQVKWPSKLKIGAKSKKGGKFFMFHSHQNQCSLFCVFPTALCVCVCEQRFIIFHLLFLDPHVKVEGKRANVLEAKRKILEVLETRVRLLVP